MGKKLKMKIHVLFPLQGNIMAGGGIMASDQDKPRNKDAEDISPENPCILPNICHGQCFSQYKVKNQDPAVLLFLALSFKKGPEKIQPNKYGNKQQNLYHPLLWPHCVLAISMRLWRVVFRAAHMLLFSGNSECCHVVFVLIGAENICSEWHGTKCLTKSENLAFLPWSIKCLGAKYWVGGWLGV